MPAPPANGDDARSTTTTPRRPRTPSLAHSVQRSRSLRRLGTDGGWASRGVLGLSLAAGAGLSLVLQPDIPGMDEAEAERERCWRA